jgi:putative sterol carrier protein
MSLAATTENVRTMTTAADALNATIKFAFNGGEGVVYIDGSDDPNQVHNEDKAADCTISIDKDDFDNMLAGNLNPMEAFMGGKLKVDGDMGVAMKLTSMFG